MERAERSNSDDDDEKPLTAQHHQHETSTTIDHGDNGERTNTSVVEEGEGEENGTTQSRPLSPSPPPPSTEYLLQHQTEVVQLPDNTMNLVEQPESEIADQRQVNATSTRITESSGVVDRTDASTRTAESAASSSVGVGILVEGEEGSKVAATAETDRSAATDSEASAAAAAGDNTVHLDPDMILQLTKSSDMSAQLSEMIVSDPNVIVKLKQGDGDSRTEVSAQLSGKISKEISKMKQQQRQQQQQQESSSGIGSSPTFASVAAARGVAAADTVDASSNSAKKAATKNGKSDFENTIGVYRPGDMQSGEIFSIRPTSLDGRQQEQRVAGVQEGDSTASVQHEDSDVVETLTRRSSSDPMASATQLQRQLIHQSSPGAFRMSGMYAQLDEDNADDFADSDFFEVSEEDQETVERSMSNGLSDAITNGEQHHYHGFDATVTTIQAVLVEEQTDQRERELAERERQVQQRELELEHKLQQMQQQQQKSSSGQLPAAIATSLLSSSANPSVIQGQADVAFAESEERKTKKKGVFGFLKKPIKKTLSARNFSIASTTPPKKHLSFTEFVRDLDSGSKAAGENKSIEEDLVMKKKAMMETGTIIVPSSASVSAPMSEFSSLNLSHHTVDGDEIYSRVPIFKAEEVLEGNQVGRCKANSLCILQSIRLDKGWVPPAVNNSHLRSDSMRNNQRMLRENAAEMFSFKDIAARYTVKRPRSGLDQRRKELAAIQLTYEAKLLMSLSHDNIMTVSGISEGILAGGVTNNDTPRTESKNYCYFTITKSIDDNLYIRLMKTWPRATRGPQFLSDRIHIATCLASAISYLHSHNIVYFDLKPENVGFDNNGKLKLHSFGAAYQLKGSEVPNDTSAFTSTPFVGTHPYVAPEVAMKQKSGLRSDVYGFSILLWEIMALKEPFEGLMIHEYTRKVIQEQKRPKLDKKIPVGIQSILMTGWQHDASRRPCMKTIHNTLLLIEEEYSFNTKK